MKLIPWQARPQPSGEIETVNTRMLSHVNLSQEEKAAMTVALSVEAVTELRNPEPRHLVLVLADNSASMIGEPIAELNKALAVFASQIAADRLIAGSVLVGLGGFGLGGEELEMFVPFTDPRKFMPPNLVACTGTPHCGRLLEALPLLSSLNQGIQRVLAAR